MLSRISVNALLKSVISVLALGVIVLLAAGAWSSWNRLIAVNRISAIRLMLLAPQRFGTMNRKGAPCPTGSGPSFIFQTSIDCGSVAVFMSSVET